jgi:hypothetical protein
MILKVAIIVFVSIFCALCVQVCHSAAVETTAGPMEIGDEGLLLQWLTEHGGSYKGVGIAEFEGMGRGIAAMRNIREGEDVLKIPSKSILYLSVYLSVYIHIYTIYILIFMAFCPFNLLALTYIYIYCR